MAQRLPDGDMQALQQFVNQSPWQWTPVRRRIAEVPVDLARSVRRGLRLLQQAFPGVIC